jgi:hypothetical protein
MKKHCIEKQIVTLLREVEAADIPLRVLCRKQCIA